MKKEIWKDIEGYEGIYKVSNTGYLEIFFLQSKGMSISEYVRYVMRKEVEK